MSLIGTSEDLNVQYNHHVLHVPLCILRFDPSTIEVIDNTFLRRLRENHRTGSWPWSCLQWPKGESLEACLVPLRWIEDRSVVPSVAVPSTWQFDSKYWIRGCGGFVSAVGLMRIDSTVKRGTAPGRSRLYLSKSAYIQDRNRV